MVPTTSGTPGGERRQPHADDAFRVERRTIQGHEALVSQYPDRLALEWRAGHPRYFGVRVGDRLKDADADVSSPRIEEWLVTDISPELVVGEHVKSGETREFDRQRVEQGLIVGNYATNLSAFDRVVVHAVGDWDTYDPDADSAVPYRGNPYVTVVAYGNNGQTYGLRYRYTEVGNADSVTLWEEDVAVGSLDSDLRTELAAAVERALTAEGFTPE